MNGLRLHFSRQNILVLMVVLAGSEGYMCTLAFTWIPSLKRDFSSLAFGTVLACFVVSDMPRG